MLREVKLSLEYGSSSPDLCAVALTPGKFRFTHKNLAFFAISSATPRNTEGVP